MKMPSNNETNVLSLALKDLPLGGVRYFERCDSTMDEAAAWLEEGAPDLALVITDEQIAGRGRLGRRWYAAPKASLTFSLILRHLASSLPTLLTGLGALAVCEALEHLYNLKPRIKWPNDVLLSGKKVCGILAESHWQGDRLLGVVIGIGINLAPSAVPQMNAVLFPATCLQDHLPSTTGLLLEETRFRFLAAILKYLLDWCPQLQEEAFIRSWEARLAYVHQTVQIFKAIEDEGSLYLEGSLEGLNSEGNLILCLANGETQTIHFGEIRLRPIPSEGGDSDVTR